MVFTRFSKKLLFLVVQYSEAKTSYTGAIMIFFKTNNPGKEPNKTSYLMPHIS